MAGRILLDLPNPSLDGNGNPVSGATLTYYETGTTTKGDIFSDRSLETPLTNPIIADSAGRFPQVWGSGDTSFDVEWRGPAGLIRTFIDCAPSQDDLGGGGGGAGFASIADVEAATVGSDTEYLQTQGYYEPGDGGGATYVKAASEPSHPGKVQTSDGVWFELRATVVNPIMFGAKVDGTTPADDAFNDMSAYVEAVKNVARIQLAADTSARGAGSYPTFGYLINEGWVLPSVFYNGDTQSAVTIDGAGTFLYSTVNGVKIVSRLPDHQDGGAVTGRAIYLIETGRFRIENLTVYGNGTNTQSGISIGATYGLQLNNCYVSDCGLSYVVLFGLQARLVNCKSIGTRKAAFVIETGEGVYSGQGWTGGDNSNSASNLTVLDQCRDYGRNTEEYAYVIRGSDSVVLRNCVAEGPGAPISVFFDYQGSPTVKLFTIEGMHFENALVKLLMQIRATGLVVINRIYYQYAAAILDMHGSTAVSVITENLPYVIDAPWTDASNPNNYLFYHTNGGGYGGTASGNSNGSIWKFRDLGDALGPILLTAARWENSTFPMSGDVAYKPNGVELERIYHFASQKFTTLDPLGLTLEANLTFDLDNTYKIGTSTSAGRPTAIYVGSLGYFGNRITNLTDSTVNLDLTPGNGARLRHQGATYTNAAGTYTWTDASNVEIARLLSTAMRPSIDNTMSSGASGQRWSVVYAATGTINTSDARTKTEVAPLSERELAAGRDLLKEIGTFQFLDAVEKKGEGARKHVGMTVQRAIEIMEGHGLEPFSYSFICHDEWAEEKEELGEEAITVRDATPEDDPKTVKGGKVTIIEPAPIKNPYRAAGDIYSFRTDGLMMFMMAGLAARLEGAVQ